VVCADQFHERKLIVVAKMNLCQLVNRPLLGAEPVDLRCETSTGMVKPSPSLMLMAFAEIASAQPDTTAQSSISAQQLQLSQSSSALDPSLKLVFCP
jgi:hypothetical protein